MSVEVYGRVSLIVSPRSLCLSKKSLPVKEYVLLYEFPVTDSKSSSIEHVIEKFPESRPQPPISTPITQHTTINPHPFYIPMTMISPIPKNPSITPLARSTQSNPTLTAPGQKFAPSHLRRRNGYTNLSRKAKPTSIPNNQLSHSSARDDSFPLPTSLNKKL